MSSKWLELYETIKYRETNKLVLEIIDVINIYMIIKLNINNYMEQ